MPSASAVLALMGDIGRGWCHNTPAGGQWESRVCGDPVERAGGPSRIPEARVEAVGE